MHLSRGEKKAALAHLRYLRRKFCDSDSLVENKLRDRIYRFIKALIFQRRSVKMCNILSVYFFFFS